MKFLAGYARAISNIRDSNTRVLSSIGWMSAHRILQLGVGLLITVWIARYFGPENFGKLSFAIVLSTIFGAVSGLGLYGIVSRDLMSDKCDPDETLGSAFTLQIAASFSSTALMFITALILRPGDSLGIQMVLILSVSMPFQAVNVIRYWLEAKIRTQAIARVEFAMLIAFSAIRLVMLTIQVEIIYFVWLMAVEAITVSFLLAFVFHREGGLLRSWRLTKGRATELISESWPLLLSSVAMVIYTKVDQLMIAGILGDSAMGKYAAAANISTVWYFFPIAIIASLAPAIAWARENSDTQYLGYLQRLFDGVVMIALAVAVLVSTFSAEIVGILYGSEFHESSQILSILIWCGVPTVLIHASGRWYLFEGLQKLALMRNIFGMSVSILLNLLLIPRYESLGAAMSTLIAVTSVAFIFDAFSQKTHVLLAMKARSLNIFGSLKRMKEMLEEQIGSDAGVS